MALTTTQLQTLKADIAVQTAASSGTAIEGLDPLNPDDRFVIRDWYNDTASPDFHVFRTSVATDAARGALVWAEVFANNAKLPAEERWGFDVLLHNGTYDPSLPNTRVGLQKIFEGGTYDQTRQNLIALTHRTATRAEKLFAVNGELPLGGDGSSTTSVANMTHEGDISTGDIDASNNV